MKKFILSILLSITTIGLYAVENVGTRNMVQFTEIKAEATADQPSVSSTLKISDFRATEEDLSEWENPSTSTNGVVLTRGAIESVDCLVGSRYTITHIYGGSVYTPNSSVAITATIVKSKDNEVTIKGFVFGDDAKDIKATVDLATGEVTIKSQQILAISEGAVYICKMNALKNTYDSSAEIKGHVYGGSIVIDDAFGFFITKGNYAGASLTYGYSEYGVIAELNGSITSKNVTFTNSSELGMTTSNRVVTPQTSPIFAYPVGNDKLRVMHMPVLSNYSDIDVTLNVNGSMQINPQPIYYNSFYGSASMFTLQEKIDAAGAITFSVRLIDPIAVDYNASEKTMTIGGWGVCLPSGKTLFGTYEGSTITLDEPVVCPQQLKLSLEGAGTEASPWLIKTAADFIALQQDAITNQEIRSNAITEGTGDDAVTYYNVYGGKYFKLANDIDFEDCEYTYLPIGSKEYRFNGNFNGDGKIIKNFTIRNYAYDHCGMFATLGANAEIYNLTFDNPYIQSIGYTVGIITGLNYGNIHDLTIVNGVVSSTSGYNVGGVCAYSYGELSNITINGITVTALGYVGGVVGRSFNNITNVQVAGRVTMTGKQVFGGGITGMATKQYLEQPQPVISNCSFGGTVTASSDQIAIGGIAGSLGYTCLTNSFATAQIVNSSASSSYVGGVVGTAIEGVISDCYSAGFVRNPNTANAGGICGHITTSITGTTVPTEITNCYTSAMISTASTETTRAIIGAAKGSVVKNCYFDNQIAPLDNAEGGLATATLTSGNAITGFNADVWSFESGSYPTLKGIEMNDAKAVSIAPMTLQEPNVITEISKNFKYSTANDVKWVALKDGKEDATGGYSFGFSNGEGVLNMMQHTDTIFAMRGNVSKYYIVNVAPVVFEGEGTSENPWLIRNKEEFKTFIGITVNATMPFEDKYFVLINDIDMGGDTILPVCKNRANTLAPSLMFQGTFDGQGHTIDNFVVMAVEFFTADNTTGTAVPGQVNPKSDKCYYNSGLFAAVGANGVVKNLTIGSKAKVHSFQRGGMIAGYLEGVIENCANYGEMRVYFAIGGGIAGYVSGGKVVNCYNAGNVYANYYSAGGIAGEITAKAVIESCANTGEVASYWFNPYQKQGSQYLAGGIVAVAADARIRNVVNSGNVWSYKQVGGIVAKATGTAAKPCVVENAVQYGFVDATADRLSLGKIAGVNSLAVFNNCYADKQIQKGGLVANGDCEGTTALSTAVITSGKVALPDSIFTQKAGAYPVLSYYKEVPAQVALNSAAVVTFADNQSATGVLSDAKLAPGVNWSLTNKAVFSIDGDVLKVILPSAGSFTDTLVATAGAATRKIAIATLNPAFLEGEGTAASPFIINDASEFIALAKFINQYDFDYEGYFFKVKNDLDFKGIEFESISSFSGTFDGNSKTFANVSYEAPITDKTALNRALFDFVNPEGTVKNLTLDENSSINAYTYAGGIVAHLYGDIENCVNKAKVTTYGTTNAGGVVSYAYVGANIVSCVNEGTVTSKTTYAGGILAGSAANAKVTISKCVNKGAVSGSSKIGGIVGSGSAIINESSNEGSVKASSTYAAGIIGEALATTNVVNSNNSGSVEATTQYNAGIVALSAAHTNENPLIIDNCHNTAKIKVGTKGYGAGIVSSGKAGTVITNCSNTGEIAGSTSTTSCIRVGGVAADLTHSDAGNTSVTNSWNEGDITCYSNAGAIVGYMSGKGAVISGCYNTGNVTGGGTSATAAINLGGILGNGASHVYDCWNAGDVTAVGKSIGGIHGANTQDSTFVFTRNANFGDVTSTKGTQVGGLIGNGRGKVSNSYNFGMVTATNDVAGIVGYPGNAASGLYTTTISNCYNAGEIVTAGSNAGNIASKNTGVNAKFLIVKNNYYDSDVNPELSYDKVLASGVKGLPTAELVVTEISSDFVLAEATYPTLKSMVDNETNSFYAATILFGEGESIDHVSKNFLIGTPKGAVWTSTGNIVVNGNTVTPKAQTDGEAATLTLTVGELTRTYDLVLYKSTGIDEVVTDEGKTVAKVAYYLVSGVQIASPSETEQVVIERTTFTDGTSKVRKLVPVK